MDKTYCYSLNQIRLRSHEFEVGGQEGRQAKFRLYSQIPHSHLQDQTHTPLEP